MRLLVAIRQERSAKEFNLDKVNILFVIPQLDKGGSETLVYDIASRLDRKLFGISLGYFHFYGNEKFRNAFQDLGVGLHQIHRNGAADFSTMRTMARIIRDNDIHIVNAHHFVSMFYSFYACKIANRCRLVYTEHSSWEIEQTPVKWRVIGKLLLRYTDCVMGISDDVTKTLSATFKLREENAVTIRNGVDLEGKRTPRDVRAIKSEFGLADDIKIVVTVANFRKVKNHLLLLQGFKELIREFDKVMILLIGQGYVHDPDYSEREVRDYIAENNISEKVILTGYRSDVKDLLSIADVFCLTSFREGLPISMLEAMSIGLPVIGTNVPGIRDVVAHGKNGFLVDLGDSKGLKDSLLKILVNDQLRCNFASESRKIAMESYSMSQCVKSYQDLFLQLVKQ